MAFAAQIKSLFVRSPLSADTASVQFFPEPEETEDQKKENGENVNHLFRINRDHD
jgi:hypothetical protein